MKRLTRVAALAVLVAVLCLSCTRAPRDVGIAAEAKAVRLGIVQVGERICNQLGASAPMLSVVRSRVDLSPKALRCVDLTLTRAELGGPIVNARSREEREAPMAERVRRMGQPALGVIRPALEGADRSPGERHVATWALTGMVSRLRPFPFGRRAAGCLLQQWEEEAGHGLPGQATLAAFQPWPEYRPAPTPGSLWVDPKAPGPPLPPPFGQPNEDVRRPNAARAEMEQRLSEEIAVWLKQRRGLLRRAQDTLRAADPAMSAAVSRSDLESSLAALRILRPPVEVAEEWVMPWLDRRPESAGSTVAVNEEVVLRTLEAFGVELLPAIRSGLLQQDAAGRQRLMVLLHRVVGGDVGVDCLLAAWAEGAPDAAAPLRALASGQGH